MRAIVAALFLWTAAVFGQGFDVASVKPSASTVGKDAMKPIVVTPTGLSAHNVTLLRLISQAYGVQPFQVTGGPGWLDSNEYDVEARSGEATSVEQLNAMLRTLLVNRFHLELHHESKELRVYELTVDKGGVKLRPVSPEERALAGRAFRGDMREFANLLAVQLSIPPIADPGRPSIASGPPVPVLDRTKLTDTYQFGIELRPEAGVDMFTLWQRALHELGLRIESRKGPVDVLVIDSVDKVPIAN